MKAGGKRINVGLALESQHGYVTLRTGLIITHVCNIAVYQIMK